MNMYAQCLEYGYGCEQDTLKAIEWYEKAASWGDQSSSDKLLILTSCHEMNPTFTFVAPVA